MDVPSLPFWPALWWESHLILLHSGSVSLLDDTAQSFDWNSVSSACNSLIAWIQYLVSHWGFVALIQWCMLLLPSDLAVEFPCPIMSCLVVWVLLIAVVMPSFRWNFEGWKECFINQSSILEWILVDFYLLFHFIREKWKVGRLEELFRNEDTVYSFLDYFFLRAFGPVINVLISLWYNPGKQVKPQLLGFK